MDYYNILGVNKAATAQDIKRAYRKLAKEHHPDHGGDAARLQQVNEAYETLKDTQRRAEYDAPPMQQQFHFNTGNVNDVFHSFFQQRHQPQRNRDITVSVTLDLIDVLNGKNLNIQYSTFNGGQTQANISIPPGVDNGGTLRIKGLGDNSHSSIPRGDLLVTIIINKHPEFERSGSDLRITKNISVLDLIVGVEVLITTLDNQSVNISIPPGFQPNQMLKVPGYGLLNPNTRQPGNLYVAIHPIVPTTSDPDLINQIQLIKQHLQI